MPRSRDRLRPSFPENARATNLKGVYTFEPPPQDFNPLTASDVLLRKYRLPLRPDPDKSPQALRAWKRAFNQPLGQFIQPVFQVVPMRRPQWDLTQAWNSIETWAGCTLSGSNWQSVWASWTIPALIPPANQGSQTEWSCSTWVGINASPSLLQVGTTQSISADGKATCIAWGEWDIANVFTAADAQQPVPFPPGRHQSQTMPVNANDTIEVQLVYAPTENLGTYIFNNITQSKWTSWIIPANASSFQGNTIAWILETPVDQTSGATTDLPDFGTVTFLNCGGCTSDKSVGGDPQNGSITTISNNGIPLTSEFLGDSSVTINYLS
jgi:hypothetical protein